MRSGKPDLDLAVYRLCKEFGWDPRWLSDQQIQVTLCGKTIFKIHYPGLTANVVNRLMAVLSTIDEETKAMIKGKVPFNDRMSALAQIRMWRKQRGR